MCLDPMSGHAPGVALEQFIEQVVEATIEEDYSWLVTVANDSSVENLMALQPVLTEDYTVVPLDDLGGTYEYEVRFDSGTTLYFILISQWPKCPDFRVTEQEVLENVRLHHVERRSE